MQGLSAKAPTGEATSGASPIQLDEERLGRVRRGALHTGGVGSCLPMAVNGCLTAHPWLLDF